MANQPLVMTNQFGEESINQLTGAVTSWTPLHPAGNLVIGTGASAPTSGASGTGDNIAGKGSFYVAQDTGLLYVNTGTISSPSWTLLEAGDSAVLSSLLTGFVSGAGTVAATDTILQAFNKLVGNTQNLAVIANLITGYTSGAGAVAATDTILQAIQKLNGNADAISTVANAALPSASFTDAAVSGKVLTGLAAGANTPIQATDTILAALANLQAQIDAL